MAHPDPGSLEMDSNSFMQTAQRLNKTKYFHTIGSLVFRRFYFFKGQRAITGGRGKGRSRLPTQQRAPPGTQSQDLEFMTKAKGRHSTN